MKYLIIFFLLISLQATGFWTLSGLEKARVVIKDDISLNPQTFQKINHKMYSLLKKNDIATDLPDSATFLLRLEKISNKDSHYVYIELILGEEVQTFRRSKDATFAITFSAHDFIDVKNTELDYEILESIDFLLSQFDELYKEDN